MRLKWKFYKASSTVTIIKAWFYNYLFSLMLEHLLRSAISLYICTSQELDQPFSVKSTVDKAHSLNDSFYSSSEFVDCRQQMPIQNRSNKGGQLGGFGTDLFVTQELSCPWPRQLLCSQALPLKPTGLSSLLLSAWPPPSPTSLWGPAFSTYKTCSWEGIPPQPYHRIHTCTTLWAHTLWFWHKTS